MLFARCGISGALTVVPAASALFAAVLVICVLTGYVIMIRSRMQTVTDVTYRPQTL
jgi:hypothetical protein